MRKEESEWTMYFGVFLFITTKYKPIVTFYRQEMRGFWLGCLKLNGVYFTTPSMGRKARAFSLHIKGTVSQLSKTHLCVY
jgi:hypothetical protein